MKSKTEQLPELNEDSTIAKTYTVSGTVKKGQRGKDVATVQTRLADLGYLTKDDIDEIFLTETEKAVKKFQQDQDLVADGICGVKTLTKLGISIDAQYEESPTNTGTFGSVEWLTQNFKKLKYDAGFETTIANAAKRCIANKDRYEAAAQLVGLTVKKFDEFNIKPWMFIACIHNMESSGSFAGVLHNGEKIIGTGKKTTLVPKGRGPFKNWEASVLDVFALKSLNLLTDFSVGNIIYQFIKFNGMGYFNKGKESPYAFAQSTICPDKGKYVADGQYSSTADANGQTGAATLLKEILKQLGPVVVEQPDYSLPVAELILKENPSLTPRMVRLACVHLEDQVIKNKKIINIVDFRINDKYSRHMIFDTATGKMLHKIKVAHGKNSDPNKDGLATEFSNVNGSYKSSLGAFLIGNLYASGKFRTARYMYGLEDGVNDNAYARAIRWHDATYVNDTEGSASGDSLGCFANSYASTDKIKPILQDTLLYAYYNQ